MIAATRIGLFVQTSQQPSLPLSAALSSISIRLCEGGGRSMHALRADAILTGSATFLTI
jgi:hypothetical protein